MNQTDNKAIQALFKIQKKLYGEGHFFKKQGKNLHFKSKYLQLPDLLAQVVPLLHDEGCMLVQGTKHSDNPDIAIITTLIIHVESGDEWYNDIDLPVSKLNPQEMGKAVTYGRRYGLEPIFGIPTKDDDGEEARAKSEEMPVKAKSVDPFEYLAEQTGMTVKAVKDRLKFLGLDTMNKVKAAGAAKLIKMLKENNEDE